MKYFWIGCLLFCGGGLCHAQEAAEVPAAESELPIETGVAPLSAEQRARIGMNLRSAESALHAGFPRLASRIAQQLGESGLDEESDRRRMEVLISAAIAQENWDFAREMLSRAPMDQPGYQIRAAILAFATRDRDQLVEMMGRLDEEKLTPADRAWHSLILAVDEQAAGNLEQANSLFQKATRLVESPILRSQFELLRLQRELLARPPSDTVISGLRETTRNLQGEYGGFEAARLLAIALAQSNRREEAQQILERQLTLPGLGDSGLRPQILLLLAMVVGEENERGRQALEEVITNATASRSLLTTALQLRIRGIRGVEARLRLLTQLNVWLDSPRPHPLRDQMLIARAYIVAGDRNFAQAESDALQLINSFPGSPLVQEALRLLAYLSWERTPARYRTAADYLNQLRQQIQPGRERSLFGVLMADCYFLNEDFSNAADAYAAVTRETGLSSSELEVLYYQKALAEIESEHYAAAAEWIDQNAQAFSINLRWRIEWNLVDQLRRHQRPGEALSRVQAVLAGGEEAPEELKLRMVWLQARLLLERNLAEEAQVAVNELITSLRAEGGWSDVEPELREQVLGHSLLLLGEVQLSQGQGTAFSETFVALREQFPGSGPAILSYLIEARSASASEALVDSQQTLIQLADLFPRSRYAPVALWEAAIQAEQRGLNTHLREAIVIMERLARDYPGNPLVFYARLKQGDLSRRLNDFGTARIIYDRLLTQFPNHPERYRADLSRADCILAQGSQEADRLEDASIAYERLALGLHIPADVRAEAGYKWATSLQLRGQENPAQAALWTIVHQFLDPGDEALRPQERGRYWLARVVFDLAEKMENSSQALEAQRLYRIIMTHGLPGQSIARARLSPNP